MSRPIVPHNVPNISYKDLTASNTWTDWVWNQGHGMALSISGTWSGTLTLQRRFDALLSDLDVAVYTGNTEKVIDDPTMGIQYRIGFKPAAYSTGTASVVIKA